jgi:hypothetical protein
MKGITLSVTPFFVNVDCKRFLEVVQNQDLRTIQPVFVPNHFARNITHNLDFR